MSDPKDYLDLKEPVARRFQPSEYIDVSKNVPYLETMDISWSAFDVGTGEVSLFDSTGGHFTCAPGARYLIFLRVTDKKGIQRIDLDGTGMFKCTAINRSGQQSSPSFVRISIPHQEFVNHSIPPIWQDLLVQMNPDIGAFDYSQLLGGWRTFSGSPEKFPLLAYQGVMTFSGTAVNSRGDVRAASLTCSP